jgi:hypothetical protein
MGYTYIGPTSFYRLTLHEIKRLQRGYLQRQTRVEAAIKPHIGRRSDWEKLRRFARRKQAQAG